MLNHSKDCDCRECLKGQTVQVITVVKLAAQNPFNRIEDRTIDPRRNLKTR